MLLGGEEGLCTTMKKKEKRKDREGRNQRQERGEIRKPRATWTSCQYLIVILISFDHFKDLSYSMS